MQFKSQATVLTVIYLSLFIQGSVFSQMGAMRQKSDSTNLGHHHGHTTHDMIHDQKKTPDQTICPVIGGDISKKVYVDHQGERVYFCCESCITTFNKEPEKYLKQLKEKGVKLEKSPQKHEHSESTQQHNH